MMRTTGTSWAHCSELVEDEQASIRCLPDRQHWYPGTQPCHHLTLNFLQAVPGEVQRFPETCNKTYCLRL